MKELYTEISHLWRTRFATPEMLAEYRRISNEHGLDETGRADLTALIERVKNAPVKPNAKNVLRTVVSGALQKMLPRAASQPTSTRAGTDAKTEADDAK